ncbi:MAG TPA: hypothetical protein VG408_03715, partial [Actinomycetota bacterium]|nr:hypothetical protein [Actinomycetota bacterium]
AAFGLILAGALTGVMPVWTLIALLAAPLALQVYRGISAHYESPYELMGDMGKGPMGKNVALHFAAGMGLVAGYLLDLVL